jgi:hypothetical protein
MKPRRLSVGITLSPDSDEELTAQALKTEEFEASFPKFERGNKCSTAPTE